MRLNKINSIALFLLPMVSFGQTVQTFIDKNEILIGEQIQYKVKATYPTAAYKMGWFVLPDTIPHFEIIGKTAIDSAIENDKTTLTQIITYTSFDSGKWALPSLHLQAIALHNAAAMDLKTDSFAINVLYAVPDSTNQLRDIKPIIEVSVVDYFWYYVVGGGLFLLLLAGVLWWYFGKKKKPAQSLENTLSAYDEAMQALEMLGVDNLTNHEVVKQYHSQIAEIFKKYFSRMVGKNMLNHTTGDILVQLSIAAIEKDEISKVAVALRFGDAVKFAKFKAAVDESENSKAAITEAIKKINQQLSKKTIVQ